MKIQIGSFPTEFNVAVRHASAVRKVTDNVVCVVTDEDGNVGLGEGCPRVYVTGETGKSARAFLAEHAESAATATAGGGLDGLQRWMTEHVADIDSNPAAFCAIELALLDVLARNRRQPVECLLGFEPLAGTFDYTAVLGDNPRLVYALMLQRYLFRGFRDFKLKLSGDLDRDRAKVRRLRRRGGVRIRVDANNLWSDPAEAIEHLRGLYTQFFGIEEPLTADDLDGFQSIATAIGSPIILDESGLRAEQIRELPGNSEHWLVNCRVSKMGGIQRSLDVVSAARERGIGLVIGAQVGETSVLSRAALTVAAAAGELLVGQEGAFGTHLLKEDFTRPVVMFDRRGRLTIGKEVDALAPGFGLVSVGEIS